MLPGVLATYIWLLLLSAGFLELELNLELVFLLDCYSALFVRLKLRQKIAKICFARYWCVPPHSHHRPNLDQKSNSFRVVNPYPPLIALIKRSAFCRSEGPALHQSQSAFTNWSWQSRPDCQRLASSLVCLFPRECGPPRHPLLLLDLL